MSDENQGQIVEQEQTIEKPHWSQWLPAYGIIAMLVTTAVDRPSIGDTRPYVSIIWHAVWANIILWTALIILVIK